MRITYVHLNHEDIDYPEGYRRSEFGDQDVLRPVIARRKLETETPKQLTRRYISSGLSSNLTHPYDAFQFANEDVVAELNTDELIYEYIAGEFRGGNRSVEVYTPYHRAKNVLEVHPNKRPRVETAFEDAILKEKKKSTGQNSFSNVRDKPEEDASLEALLRDHDMHPDRSSNQTSYKYHKVESKIRRKPIYPDSSPALGRMIGIVEGTSYNNFHKNWHTWYSDVKGRRRAFDSLASSPEGTVNLLRSLWLRAKPYENYLEACEKATKVVSKLYDGLEGYSGFEGDTSMSERVSESETVPETEMEQKIQRAESEISKQDDFISFINGLNEDHPELEKLKKDDRTSRLSYNVLRSHNVGDRIRETDESPDKIINEVVQAEKRYKDKLQAARNHYKYMKNNSENPISWAKKLSEENLPDDPIDIRSQ